MRLLMSALLMLLASTAHSAVVNHPIKSGIGLNPGETYTLEVQATDPLEIGWRAVKAKPCASNCVQATEVINGASVSFATQLGATKKHTPAAGMISIEYKNVSNEPVMIDVFRVQRTCDAEACKFLGDAEKGRWLVFKVDEFRSISTSKDESYSDISGIAVGGKPFTVKVVWWTDEKQALMVNCAPFVKKYLDNQTPKESYAPYVVSGKAVQEQPSIVLTRIDTCAPKAPKFGVPEENVFK